MPIGKLGQTAWPVGSREQTKCERCDEWIKAARKGRGQWCCTHDGVHIEHRDAKDCPAQENEKSKVNMPDSMKDAFPFGASVARRSVLPMRRAVSESSQAIMTHDGVKHVHSVGCPDVRLRT